MPQSATGLFSEKKKTKAAVKEDNINNSWLGNYALLGTANRHETVSKFRNVELCFCTREIGFKVIDQKWMWVYVHLTLGELQHYVKPAMTQNVNAVYACVLCLCEWEVCRPHHNNAPSFVKADSRCRLGFLLWQLMQQLYTREAMLPPLIITHYVTTGSKVQKGDVACMHLTMFINLLSTLILAHQRPNCLKNHHKLEEITWR